MYNDFKSGKKFIWKKKRFNIKWKFIKCTKTRKKKIPILIPEPLDLNDYSFENEEDDFKNLSYIKSEDDQFNINLFSSWSTKASDDEMGKNSNINNTNEKIDCQKKITIFELLKKSSKL